MRLFSLAALLVALLPSVSLAATPRTAVLDVQNMSCNLCPVTVKKSLQKVPGVSQARIDSDNKTAIVSFDAEKTGTAALIRATTDAGYPSTLRK